MEGVRLQFPQGNSSPQRPVLMEMGSAENAKVDVETGLKPVST